MAGLSKMALHASGKLRRFVQAKVLKQDTDKLQLFPLHPKDLREVDECSYTFLPEPAAAPNAPDPAAP